MKNFLKLAILMVFLSGAGVAKAELPADFKFVYTSSAGASENIATREVIQVTGEEAVVVREAKNIGADEKSKTSQAYAVNREQLDKLYEIVKNSGFTTWPASTEVERKSQADEAIEVTLDGKTVRHTKWEEANDENFRILYNQFNRWWVDLRSVRF